MRRFPKKQPQTHLLVSIPSQAGQEIACRSTKMHILQDCVFEGKKCGRSQAGKTENRNWFFREWGSSLASHETVSDRRSSSATVFFPGMGTTGNSSCRASVWWERERERRDFFQLLFRQLEREKLGNGCIKVEPVLSSSHCGGWYSR